MNTVADVLAACESEVGYTECPRDAQGRCTFTGHSGPGANHTKFAAEAGLPNGVYWCDVADVAIYKRCGVPLPHGCVTTSTRQSKTSWEAAGQWVGPQDVAPGDQLVYCVEGRNGKGVPDHVGICAAVYRDDNGHVTSVVAYEGNTSPTTSGSQGNGGGFFRKKRPISVVLGAGRPAYDSHANPTPSEEIDDMILVHVKETNTTCLFTGDDYINPDANALAELTRLGVKTVESNKAFHDWAVRVSRGDERPGG